MLRVENVKVYDLKESVIACRNSMRLELPEYTDEEFEKSLERARKLAPLGGGHSNFLSGIRVAFDLVYPNYISPELQRYTFFKIVNSSSKMHRLSKVNYPQTKDFWALDVEKSSCIGHDNISHLSWVFTYPHVAMLRAALTSASATLPQCAQRKCLPCLMPM